MLLLISCSMENERGEEELMVNFARKTQLASSIGAVLREGKSNKEENRTCHLQARNVLSFGNYYDKNQMP